MILNVINTSGKDDYKCDFSDTQGHKKTVILLYSCYATHSQKEFCLQKTTPVKLVSGCW